MIPKIIHCCWFGGGRLPRQVNKFLKTWKEKLPDYEIRIWTEDDFDPRCAIQYVKEAYECGKYAFVSDYVRLYALYKYGGIYLDTDVEVLKSFDPFLCDDAFMSFESEERLSTAIIAAAPSSEWVKELLEGYHSRKFIVDGKMDLTTNVSYITDYFIKSGLICSGKLQVVKDVTIYPSEVFSPKSWGTGVYNVTEATICVHHFAGTWHSLSTRILSLFFSNETIINIASLKEKFINAIKYVFAQS